MLQWGASDPCGKGWRREKGDEALLLAKNYQCCERECRKNSRLVQWVFVVASVSDSLKDFWEITWFLFLWWARAAGGCWEGWTGQKYPQCYPWVCSPLLDANLLFLKSWISSSYSSHPSCLDCELIWIRVVLCHEFVKSLAPLASECARMLKWTQLSENLRFHAVLKTKILKLFVGVRYLFNFGMINILCFHNKWVSCDLWHVLVEKSLAWELVGWCVCVSYQIYLCFTSSSVTTWKGLHCGYS